MSDAMVGLNLTYFHYYEVFGDVIEFPVAELMAQDGQNFGSVAAFFAVFIVFQQSVEKDDAFIFEKPVEISVAVNGSL